MFGDDSSSKRPMDRATIPSADGSRDCWSAERDLPPLKMKGSRNCAAYSLSAASGFRLVGSALDFCCPAGSGRVDYYRKGNQRNHTEDMIAQFCEQIEVKGKWKFAFRAVRNSPAQEVTVPGDTSSAAFWLVAGLIVPDSSRLFRNVGINETQVF